MDFPPKASHKHLSAERFFFCLTSQPVGSNSQYYKVSFVSSGSMGPWDPSTLPHMGILCVRGLLSLDVASRHKLSCTGIAGTIPLDDLWVGDVDKITWKPGYSSKGNSRELSE